jgi:hypothetical protein
MAVSDEKMLLPPLAEMLSALYAALPAQICPTVIEHAVAVTGNAEL